MTEGGDFDKLGRGAILRRPPENCIHQNHVFRVRTKRTVLLPDYFHHFLQMPETRDYFLKCAKRTTNLASINMTQLKALPVAIPPLEHQLRLVSEVEKVEFTMAKAKKQNLQANNLYISLQSRAFRGEL